MGDYGQHDCAHLVDFGYGRDLDIAGPSYTEVLLGRFGVDGWLCRSIEVGISGTQSLTMVHAGLVYPADCLH